MLTIYIKSKSVISLNEVAGIGVRGTLRLLLLLLLTTSHESGIHFLAEISEESGSLYGSCLHHPNTHRILGVEGQTNKEDPHVL